MDAAIKRELMAIAKKGELLTSKEPFSDEVKSVLEIVVKAVGAHGAREAPPHELFADAHEATQSYFQFFHETELGMLADRFTYKVVTWISARFASEIWTTSALLAAMLMDEELARVEYQFVEATFISTLQQAKSRIAQCETARELGPSFVKL